MQVVMTVPEPSEAPVSDREDEPKRRPFGLKRLVAFAIAPMVLAAVGLLWWQPWSGPDSCVVDDKHVIDEEAGLCFAIPDGWERTEAAAEAPAYTTALRPSDAESSASVLAGRLDAVFTDGRLPDEEPLAVAEYLVAGPADLQAATIESTSEPLEIGGHEAAVAASRIEQAEGSSLYLQATVVDIDGELAVVIGSALGEDDDLVDAVEAVHDSISIR